MALQFLHCLLEIQETFLFFFLFFPFFLHPNVPELLICVNAAMSQTHVECVSTELCTLETAWSPMSRCLRHGPLCIHREVIGYRDLNSYVTLCQFMFSHDLQTMLFCALHTLRCRALVLWGKAPMPYCVGWINTPLCGCVLLLMWFCSVCSFALFNETHL